MVEMKIGEYGLTIFLEELVPVLLTIELAANLVHPHLVGTWLPYLTYDLGRFIFRHIHKCVFIIKNYNFGGRFGLYRN